MVIFVIDVLTYDSYGLDMSDDYNGDKLPRDLLYVPE
jgi:hypothetical protein